MKLLVLGSGGREHAILWTLNQTSNVALELYCAPGNAGIAEIAACRPVSLTDHSALIELVKSEAIDLTMVGPEVPLSEGIVDGFERNGLAIVGPNQAASRLESSKAFAKDFMVRHKIPTAEYRVVKSPREAEEILRSGVFGPAVSRAVIKADGLAGGKGVIVANSLAEAEESVRMLMSGELRGEAARQLVIEEALWGREASLLLFADGRDYALMPPARDHKRIGENDTGPNTGGMGAVTGTSILEEKTLQRVVRDIVEPTLAGARAEGFPFRGVLFLGLMLTSDGPKLLEYNVRMGDPETQAILVRLKTSLLDIFQAIRTGKLREVNVEWTNDSSACVVLASRGYPGKYKMNVRIEGLDVRGPLEDVTVFHAGTKRSKTGELLTAGGRVLAVTARGETLEKALGYCYKAVAQIKWEGMQYRRDIGMFRTRP
ncbi:phosphoribosylamine--glycine ligase [soil metagenome]